MTSEPSCNARSATYPASVKDRSYCQATTVLTRTVIVPPEGGRFTPLPSEPTREETIPCEANGGDKHSCIGPLRDHGERHMCRCGWTWVR